ncbi:DgyrCDS205 [Dimorphilus gyrociliatus]|uniref:DgyrCDS205 n=1 Tax=Dimorphilus gyrociliatus TaxID=2664684 RepID=A0A7I8V451_9ANNE|nr:DgyrCDS205 [Dimorphilus gyrociliatus]
MPSGKRLDDTWKTDELKNSLKKDEKKKSSKDKERKEDRDREKKRDKKKDEDRDRKRDKERRKDEDSDRKHRKDDGERERRRPKEDEDEGERQRRKEERRKRKEGGESEKKERKYRDEDDDEKRRRRKDETSQERDERRRRRKEETSQEREERRRRRKDETSQERDERRRRKKDETSQERDERRRRRKEETSEEREKRKREERRKRKEDKENEDNDDRRRHRRDETSEERRKRHEEKKEKRRKEKEERERQEEEERRRQEELAKQNNEDENNYDNYEDDFEDYDDDFEDDAGGGDDSANDEQNNEMSDLMKAMNDENERLLKDSRKRDNDYDDDEESGNESDTRPEKSGSTFINFVSAKQRVISNAAMSKTKKRGQELLKLIELDCSNLDMFDMPPVNEYDLYIRSFGRADTQQVYIQTNEDNADKDNQTEEIDYRDKWSQHPPEGFKACGTGDGNDENEISTKPDDIKRLNKFLNTACQAVLTLLEENLMETKSEEDPGRKKSRVVVSEEYIQLAQLEFLKDFPVRYATFSPTQSNLLIIVHEFSSKKEEANHNYQKGLICMWNVGEPSFPQKILTCENEPMCACFSPNKATLIFAGLSDGSLVVWDLREASNFHKTFKDESVEYVLRGPTYNTAAILENDNHYAPIKSVTAIISPDNTADSGFTKNGSSIEGLTFQIATLDESGVVSLWVVAEISNPDPAGSQTDFGLAPGGRVKLIKSSSIYLESPLRDTRLRSTLQCTDFAVLPSDPSHFYVTTNTGCIIHGIRYGGKAPPKAYRNMPDLPVTVTCIDFSPFTEPVFLTGSENGEIHLYHTRSENPLLSWSDTTEGRAIKFIKFCRSRPSVFFVVDEMNTLYIWDLSMLDSGPAKTEKISEINLKAFCLSNDHSATGQGLPGRKPQMILAFEDSVVEVHTVSQKFSALFPEEVDQFAELINNSL